jgi:hypothetical protein
LVLSRSCDILLIPFDWTDTPHPKAAPGHTFVCCWVGFYWANGDGREESSPEYPSSESAITAKSSALSANAGNITIT